MEKLNMLYDKEGDVLDVIMGKPEEAVMKEVSQDVFLRLHPKTKKIVGLTVLHFQKKFSRTIPVKAEFALATA
jgi:hypothetical protein